MLITRASFDENQMDVPQEATRSDFLLKRLDELLKDEDLLEHDLLLLAAELLQVVGMPHAVLVVEPHDPRSHEAIARHARSGHG